MKDEFPCLGNSFVQVNACLEENLDAHPELVFEDIT